MTNPDPSAPAAAKSKGFPTPLVVLAVVVLACAGAWYFLRPTWRTWCHGADQPEYAKKIHDESDPGIVDVMVDVMRDRDQAQSVRVALADLLLEKNRVGAVEAALKDPRLDLRVVAIRALSRKGYFRKQYVENESWGVRKTIEEWLSDASAGDRAIALSILPSLYAGKGQAPDAVVALVRGLVATGPKGASQSAVRAAAAMTLAGWEDCTAAGAILAIAKGDEEHVTRLRALQSAVQLYDLQGGACKEQLPEAEVLSALDAALAVPGDENGPRALRMGAAMILERHPEWAKARVDRLRATLHSTSAHEVERRAVLEALVSAKDPSTIDGLARWLFDATPGVRSSAIQTARPERSGWKPLAYESCLVGYLRDEQAKSSEGAFRVAMADVRQRAGTWVGLPAAWAKKGGSIGEVSEPLHRLYTEGKFEDATRASFGDALYAWLLLRAGLKDADAGDMAKRHAEFWSKAKAGDVAGAKAAYEAGASKNADLWAYERGWVQSKS